MKKNILFLILFVFAVTVKASSNKELCSISAPEPKAGLYAQSRSDERPLDERLKSLKMQMVFKDVKLTLLNPKDESLSESDPNKSIKLLRLEKEQSEIVLRATLINGEMEKSISGLLLALFSPAKSFMDHLKQQAENENVYFKISGLYGQSNAINEFYFSVPSKRIISDLGLEQLKSEKPEVSEKKVNSSVSWIKYAISFGLLAIFTVWYFNYKH